MKNALIYARVSTEEQAKEGQSIEAQVKMCKAYADQNQMKVVEIYKDEGKSATNMNRPALQELLVKVEGDDLIDCILVQDTDRLARNTLDHLSIKNIFNKNKVALISISQPLIDSSPEGNFIDTVLAATNALQSQITGRKTSKIMEQKAKAGFWPSVAPMGYKNVENPNPTSSFDKRYIVPDKHDGELVTRLFNEYSTGKYNLNQISLKLFNLGLKSSTGEAVTPSQIAHIMNHPLYYGGLPWKENMYKGLHKPLITKEVWDRCQKVLADHNQHASRKRVHDYLLRGYIYCKDTGARYWAAPHKGNGVVVEYYFRKGNPKGTYIKVDDLEKQVEDLFGKLKMTPKYVDELLTGLKSLIAEQRSLSESDRKSLQTRLNKQNEKIREAEDRLLDKTFSPERFREISARLESESREIEAEIHKLDDDYSRKFERIQFIANMALDLYNTYKRAEKEEKRYLLNLFFSKIYVKDGKVIDAEPSAEIKPFIKNGVISVRVVSNWLPD